ncbi:hypothetical protein WDZ17_08265 [Pseudokineococcus basanitobsidens]|uniref:RNA methylase family UPF0020 n=1 Tax=Pseudokineococcus basanitobsidens TaxID=1926649 RepID=A0ABU8RJQ3_9ACTN
MSARAGRRRWAVLVTPVANRAYAGDAPRLLAVELATVLGERARDVVVEDLAGTRFVTLTTPGPLDDASLQAVAAASTAHALFGRRTLDDGQDALVPVRLPAVDRYDDDLVTIPRYPGKTNEHLTRMMLGLATSALDLPSGAHHRRVLLDPLAGRGTTLSLGLLAGLDVVGVEVDAADVDAYRALLTRWLREKRLKHSVSASRLRVGGRTLGTRLDATLSPSKEAARAGDVQTLALLGADALDVGPVLGRAGVDLLVTDLPYGVAHGSVRGGALARSPRELLAAGLPVWVPSLRRGGAVAMSWNTHVLPRAELERLLVANGLDVTDVGADGALAHRVDQAVHRDVVVARRPRGSSAP